MAKLGGSYAYGTPTEKSDVDLVVQLTEDDEGTLRRALGLPEWGVVRIGKLNLIVARTEAQYDTWCEGINQLKRLAPVTRDQAVAHFDKLFDRKNVEQTVNGADSKTEFEAGMAARADLRARRGDDTPGGLLPWQ